MAAGETSLDIVRRRVEEARAGPWARRPFVLGICGAQGSGKSTLAEQLVACFENAGIPTATLSLDDLYLTRAERETLARDVHPLFLTRGVPGTHDIALGLEVIAALERGEGVALPRFDKATDDRAPGETWPHAPAGTEILIVEGWCVGATPEPEEALVAPINRLEAEEDADGRWRRHANAALAGDYQRLFGRIDLLALLLAPSFDVVLDWRVEQEAGLRARAGSGGSGVMTDAQVARFIQHYERLTRHIMADMPGRADVVIRLDRHRRPLPE